MPDPKNQTGQKTMLLPPCVAVGVAWALTGAFSDDAETRLRAEKVESGLQALREEAAKQKDEKEKNYVLNAISLVSASRRSLEIVHKGRELNFDENEKLRKAYLDSIEENLQFGKSAKDFLKSLPTMTVGTAGGVTLASLLPLKLSNLELFGLGLFLAGAGYLVNLLFVRKAREKTQQFYIRQDYERGVYFHQYIARVRQVLVCLHDDIDRIHKRYFDCFFADDSDYSAKKDIDEMLSGVGSKFCNDISRHIKSAKMNPLLWSLCESSGTDGENDCLFKGKKL